MIVAREISQTNVERKRNKLATTPEDLSELSDKSSTLERLADFGRFLLQKEEEITRK